MYKTYKQCSVDFQFYCDKKSIYLPFYGGKNSKGILLDEYWECTGCEKLDDCRKQAKLDIVEILNSGKTEGVFKY